MKTSILIISYVPPYNRQGFDIAESLRSVGYDVRLYQMNGISDKSKNIIGVKCTKPHGAFHKFHMILNLMRFLFRTLFRKKDIVICIGKPMLILGGFYNIFFRSKLIWYSLEYSKLGALDRFVYQKCVSGYIDVEENRREAIFAEYGGKAKSLVCYNMPNLRTKSIIGGKLRNYLKKECGLIGDEQVIIYAGSYQSYACLDNIVKVSQSFDENRKLVLMMYGIPDHLKSLSKKCIVVPPVHGEDFYEWLSDADCALLPYESKDDFNVQNCSPQKIFDCYCVGVPYIASNRPLIRKCLAPYPDAGIVCDFTNIDDIKTKIETLLSSQLDRRTTMQTLHKERFNYGVFREKTESLINSVLEKQT